MATYPGGVFSPSAKSAGQTIQAAWFNDPDGEITAVENALLNGLAHSLTISTGGLTVSTGGLRVGGPSTLAGTLQVTGNSTITGAVQVTGNSTFTGNLQVTGNSTMTGDLAVSGTLTVAGSAINGRRPSVRLTHSVNQTVGSGSWTGLSWNTEQHDSTGLHSTASNSSRIALTSSGMWMIGGQVAVTMGGNPSTTVMGIRVVANDNEAVVADVRFLGTGAQEIAWGHPVSGLWYATDTTGFVTLQAYQSAAANATVTGSTGGGQGPTQFWALRVSE